MHCRKQNLTYLTWESHYIFHQIYADGLSGNIIMDVYDSIKVILFKIFKVSLEEAIFSEKLKKGDKENVENYRPISIFPVFSIVLERIMYNGLYDFMNNDIFHENQFGFQINNSTENAIL